MILIIPRPAQKNRLAKYYLYKWSYLEKNINNVNQTQQVQAKILFSSLKKLTPDDLKFLADKYRTDTSKGRTGVKDSIMAERYGVGVETYVQQRITIESKLTKFIDASITFYKEDLYKAIDLNVRGK